MDFYLLTWEQFDNRKLIPMSEIVKTDDVPNALAQIKTMNAQKRLTTTEYKAYNLTEKFANNGLSISEVIKEAN